jgi:ABC-2 type transport system permease protein
MEFEELRAVRLVFWREYLIRVLTPSFIVTTLATPVLLLVIGALPALFAAPHLFAYKHIVVACNDPSLGTSLCDRLKKSSPLGRHKVDLVSEVTPQERRRLATMVRESRIDGFLWVDDDAVTTGVVAYETRAQPDFLEKQFIQGALGAEITRARLAHHGLKLAEIDAALGEVSLEPIALGTGTTTEASTDNDTAAFFITLMSITLLEMSLLSYGIIVMRSVLEDKSSRVVELLLCAATPRALMTGKIAGVGAVSLTQVAIWGVTFVAVTALGAQATGLTLFGALHIPTSHLILFGIFYLLGYLLYSSLYAALGAAFNTADEAQNWNFILTLPLLFSGIAAWSLIERPNSITAVILSMFPPCAPVMMSMRIAAGAVSGWQVAVSLALLAGAIYLSVIICSRIYRVGILMYGKKPSMREVARWLRYA